MTSPASALKTPRKIRKVSKGLSIDEPLYLAACAQAAKEGRSFAAYVRQTIQRDLELAAQGKDTVALLARQDEIIPISEVCDILHLSVWTVRRRASRKGDPLRLARSRIGKQKPMHFVRSKITELERKLAA